MSATATDAAEEGRHQAAAVSSSEGLPRVLGERYLLEERIAMGGMASVWRAHDELLARTVAIKLLHDHLASDEDFRERFRREAIAAAKLTHPNVVSLYDTGSDNERVYLVMEFVDGLTLKEVISDLGVLEPGQAALVGEKIARALAYAHERGLVHRDVKPANILLGEGGVVKVADFGIAKADESSHDLTRTGMVLGTAAYVAPEQVLALPVSGQADQYALGCVLYEALTGQQPFRGESPVATAALRLEQDPLPLRSLRADCPRGLSDIVLRALARDAEQRYPTTGDLADALNEYAEPDQTRILIGVGAAGRPHVAAGHPGPRAVQPEQRPAATPPPMPVGEDSFLRSEGRWLAPVLALLALAGALVGVGLATGILETGAGFPIQFARDGAVRAGEPTALVPVTDIQAFDPAGDGSENDPDLPALLDGDPATTWRTDLYNNAQFGNLKPGVGFWIDLGRPHALELLALRTSTPGVSYEVRVADQPAAALEGWRTVATVAQARPEVTEVRPEEAVTARYVLVWITGNLQPRSGRFTAEFSALAVRGQPR